MDKTAGVCKEQGEKFILLKVLPHLEESWGKCSSSNEEVYKILAKISCSVNSGTVVRHALQLLSHLICRDNFASGSGNLLVLEEITRSSIFSCYGMFRKDEHSEQNLKLVVYSHILSLLLMQQVQHVGLPIGDLEEELKKVDKELRRRCGDIKNKAKDRFRYSMEFIQGTISYLLKLREKSITTSKLKGFIQECQEFCQNSNMESEHLKIFRAKKRKWIYLHCILIHLHGKVRTSN